VGHVAQPIVLWDLDGTVWDSAAWYTSLCGPGTGNVANRLSTARCTGARFQYECMTNPPEIFDGVVECLEILADHGHPLGVVTSLPKWMVQPMLDGSGLSKTFKVVVPHSRALRTKKHQLIRAMSVLGGEVSVRHWYLGDTEGDRNSALAVGLSFAWAGWSVEPLGVKEPILRHPSAILKLVN
jgi:phosphoglycolate phosphatase-like HAD superfamily hydrolase